MDGTEKYLRFSVNIPEIVALKYPEGLAAPSQREGYSDQVRYSLCDGRVMYVAPFAADLITKEGIQPGEQFSIGKFECREGQRRLIKWKIQRIEPEPETPLAANLRRSAEMVRESRRSGAAQSPIHPTPPQPAPRAAPVRAIPQAAPSQRPAPNFPTSSTPATSEAVPMPRNSPTTGNSNTLPPTKLPMDEAMLHCLLIAGRATREAEKRLGAEGGSVRFDSRDVAALGTTLLITGFQNYWFTYTAPKDGIK
jgi:hypothetical protein